MATGRSRPWAWATRGACNISWTSTPNRDEDSTMAIKLDKEHEKRRMPYTAEISRYNPTAFLFLIDRSGSMDYNMSNGITKAQMLSDVVNRTIANLIVRCTKSEGTRDYFDVGVIGYGGNEEVVNAMNGELSNSIFNKISDIEKNYLRIEERVEKISDGMGGFIEQTIPFPVWVEPEATGRTPMCAAAHMAAEELVTWCSNHPNSFPPTVLNITDGDATDGEPEELLKAISELKVSDGSVLLFNLHLCQGEATPIQFPSKQDSLTNAFAKMLFRCSSILPDHILKFAEEKGYVIKKGARGFIFNADPEDLAQFFDIGTRAKQL